MLGSWEENGEILGSILEETDNDLEPIGRQLRRNFE